MLPSTNVQSLIGATLYGRDRQKLGKVDRILVDAGDGHPTWAAVRVGLLAAHDSYVPLDHAVWEDDDLFVDYDKDQVKAAPTIEGAEGLAPEQEVDLRRHFGLLGAPDDQRATEAVSGVRRDDPVTDSIPLPEEAAAHPDHPATQGAVREDPTPPEVRVDDLPPHDGGVGHVTDPEPPRHAR